MPALKKSRSKRPVSPRPVPIQAELPLAPTVNAAYPTVIKYKRGRWGQEPYACRVASLELRAYKKQVEELFLTVLRLPAGSWEGVSAIGYTVTVFVASRASDLDNRLKALQDAVVSYLGSNDNRVEEIHAYRRIDPASPRIEIEVYPVRQAQRGEK